MLAKDIEMILIMQRELITLFLKLISDPGALGLTAVDGKRGIYQCCGVS